MARPKISFYIFLEFLEVCKALKFAGRDDYRDCYKVDKKLPCCPEIIYREVWVKSGGWECIKVSKMYTFPEFLGACQEMKFLGKEDYRARYKKDPKFPSAPELFYKEDWGNAGGWWCVSNKFYLFTDFVKACIKMEITGYTDYKNRYKQDPKLPSNPHRTYKEDWVEAGKWKCVT